MTARDEMHLDLYYDDADAEVARLIGLGARFERENPNDEYVVLLEPEGNECCVCAVPEMI